MTTDLLDPEEMARFVEALQKDLRGYTLEAQQAFLLTEREKFLAAVERLVLRGFEAPDLPTWLAGNLHAGLAEAFLQLATVIVTHQQLMVGERPAVGERLN